MPSDAAPLAIGVDIGRTKIAAGVVSHSGCLGRHLVVPTPEPRGDLAAVADTAIGVIRSLQRQNPQVVAVGIGSPEVVEWPKGSLIDASGAPMFPLREYVSDSIGLPTFVDSDANAAAWGEFRFGAARGKRDVVVLTVGTGIGGGLIMDGRLHRGAEGFAGEVGHMVVDPAGEVCTCGNVGCWEALASGSALGRDGRRAATNDPSGVMATLAGIPENVTGEIVAAAARRGDPSAMLLLERVSSWLGLGIASLVLIFDPELLVIGGGLSRNGELLLGPARSRARRNVCVRANRMPDIVQARFQAQSGIIGAAALALDGTDGHLGYAGWTRSRDMISTRP